MRDSKVKKYLMIFRVGDKHPDIKRLTEAFADVKEVLKIAAIGEIQPGLQSHDGSTIGLLFKSTYEAHGIGALLTGNTSTRRGGGGAGTAALLNDDSFLITEIGESFTGHHFVRAWTWLQHN